MTRPPTPADQHRARLRADRVLARKQLRLARQMVERLEAEVIRLDEELDDSES